MKNALDLQVDIKFGSVEMVLGRKFDVKDLPHRGFTKPGESLEGKKYLLLSHQEPETMLRNIRDFNRRTVGSRRCVCHPHAPLTLSLSQSHP